MAKVEHVIFDLSEVLINGLMDAPEAIVRACPANHPELDNPGFYRRINHAFFASDYGGRDLVDLFVGKIDEGSFWEGFQERGDLKTSVDLKKVIRDNFWEFNYTQGLLDKLKSRGYDLILLSDHGREWVEYIESNFSFLSTFDARVYSFDSGHTKRDEEAFSYAIEETGIDPNRTLIVDDMLSNTIVARAYGIGVPHCFRTPERLERHLRELEIL